MNLTPELLGLIRQNIAHAKRSPFYARHFAGIEPEDIQTEEGFRCLPFTGKEDLRDAYPLGLCAVPQEDVVRIHSSSGTTGAPVIIPYTQRDVDDWAVMFKRCLRDGGRDKGRPGAYHPGLRPVDGGHRLPAGRGAAGGHGHPHGAGQH